MLGSGSLIAGQSVAMAGWSGKAASLTRGLPQHHGAGHRHIQRAHAVRHGHARFRCIHRIMHIAGARRQIRGPASGHVVMRENAKSVYIRSWLLWTGVPVGSSGPYGQECGRTSHACGHLDMFLHSRGQNASRPRSDQLKSGRFYDVNGKRPYKPPNAAAACRCSVECPARKAQCPSGGPIVHQIVPSVAEQSLCDNLPNESIESGLSQINECQKERILM